MILEDEVLVSLCSSNIKYYEDLGYEIPRRPAKGRKKRLNVPKGSKILVKVDDLPKGSNEMIHCKCDYCGEHFDRMYCLIHRDRVNGNVKDSCGKPECSKKKRVETNIIKYGSNSIVEICKQNNSNIGRKLKYTLNDFISEFNKYNLDIVVELIDDVGRMLVTDNIPFICRNHPHKGVQYTTLDILRNKMYCCKYGAIEATIERQSTVDISDAQKICEERDYTLLTDKITSVDSDILYICNKHPDYGVQHTTLYGMNHYDTNCRLCAMLKNSGENNWNWKGGVTAKNESERKSWKYKEWRQAVYERDNFTCQCCGKTINEVMINAHHIINFSDNEELRYDINNGIVLCEECHSVSYPQSFHSIYGTSNNTKEQLDEYIKNKQN